MSSSFVLLLFCPLVFSAHLALSDFGDEFTKNNPNVCAPKAFNAVRTPKSSPTVFTEKELETTKNVLQKCISEMALVNPKVKSVEKQLFEKMFHWFKFTVTEMYTCDTKLIRNDCYRSMAQVYDRDKMLGENGCMVRMYDEYCGKGMSKKMRDLMLFIDGDRKKNVDARPVGWGVMWAPDSEDRNAPSMWDAPYFEK